MTHPHEFYRFLLDTSLHWELFEDTSGTIVYCSSACVEYTGYTPERFLKDSQFLECLIHKDHQEAYGRYKEAVLSGTSSEELIVQMKRVDGSVISLEFTGRRVQQGDQAITGVRTTVRRVQCEELSSGSSCIDMEHDPLTGLFNRKGILERLGTLLTHAEQNKNFSYAVIYLDIDRLKKVNDALGPSYGDELIRQVGQRLSCSSCDATWLGRLNGDEFLVLLQDINAAGVMRRVKELKAHLAQPFILSDHEVSITASIGIVLSPALYQRPEDLLRNANIAMRRAKLTRHRFKVFNSRLLEESVKTMEIEVGLNQGLARGEFFLQYQPIISLEKEILTGLEALIRWRHPKWGVISPTEFLPVAEATDFIVPLGNWVLKQACSDLVKLKATRSDMQELSISVNLSARQLAQYDLVDQVEKALAESGLEPQYLKLEITETVAMENPHLTAQRLHMLKAKGVRISIDDFGTGYSSLSYLQLLPLDSLKVDRSFVSRMHDNPDKRKIVRSVINLAHNLHLDVVAEGVEVAEQWSMLKVLDCEDGQGFYMSKPLGLDKVADLDVVGIIKR
ncbi:sensor domain-containing protein [Desulfovibrio inopinatus]|uniref:sensor domain-containing protein n=1 Tax=Desulfovibrio inopinatus TaxID=102109 RepID=UPI000401CF5B|nr:GGDEF domain-containing protein [Desulfovibrio inopinatus]